MPESLSSYYYIAIDSSIFFLSTYYIRWCSSSLSVASFVEKGLNIFHHCLGFDSWVVVSNDLSILVNQELSKVPWDFLDFLLGSVVEFTVHSEELENVMRVGAIDLDFLEDGPLTAVEVANELLDFLVSTRLLVHELVAGEGQDLKTLVPILLVQSHKLSIVLVCQSSLRGHIYN